MFFIVRFRYSLELLGIYAHRKGIDNHFTTSVIDRIEIDLEV